MAVTSSCKNQLNLSLYISQNRQIAYTAACENYQVTLYGEERETPFISDGYVGSMKKVLTVRIEDYKTALDDASITLTYGDYTAVGKFEFSPLNGKFTTEIEVEKLPTDSEIYAVINSGGEEEKITLKTFLIDGEIGYNEALSSVSKTAAKEINNMLEEGGSIEVRLRKIIEKERLYYYVSIIDKTGKTLAYLVDGSNASILATKNL